MFRLLLIALSAAISLIACGNKGSDEKKVATQVAARVNKEEISIHQVNNVLAHAGNVKPEQAKQLGRQVLDKLIEQELLVQQAMEKKLDRDPRVMQAIEAAKREILSRAYVEQTAGSIAKPDDTAVKDFYDKNPALFRERRVFNLQELVINASPEQVSAVQEQVKQAKSMDDLVNYLRNQKIQFNANAGVKAAEQLPLEILPKFQDLKDGETALIPTPAGLTLVHVAASQVRPLDEAAARPFIEQYLSNQKRNEVAEAQIKRLRETAKIEYMGDFAQTDSPALVAPASAARTNPAAGPAAAASSASKTPDKALEKGISGLK
ncbi:MAG: peptidyl-prolyl cis-trans isomerase, EpsD family [Sterolibacteriaceae bacterium]|nr:peptidyl-prolyl cis-trans isomerase, EpsD family [Sterolibacteriaceae bacterium]MBK9084245.1 peptidyl-prolyl cis-trans isomerase, EpsD family [Sterolibacteriaceae bacterium]